MSDDFLKGRGLSFAQRLAGKQDGGRRAGRDAVQLGERGAHDLLIGLSGAGDDDAGKVRGEAYAAQLGRYGVEIASRHVDDVGCGRG